MAVKVGLRGAFAERLGEDGLDVLNALAEEGLDGVELAESVGDFGPSHAQIKERLDEVGLDVACMSCGTLGTEVPDIGSALDLADLYGTTYMMLAFGKCSDEAWIEEYAPELDKLGRRCADRGKVLVYHNHDHEFQRAGDGRYKLDVLLSKTDPELVKVILDAGWAKSQNVDVPAYLHTHLGRIPLLHLRDLGIKEGTREDRLSLEFVEVGTGIVDFPSWFEAAEKTGVEWASVEWGKAQRGDRPKLESALMGVRNLRSMGLAGRAR
jgi:sugar phosphate isomerase/epimerase